ncbi:MAG: helicase-related protein, partial [Pseudomonadota bacterium]|nr:helicase-related protein [Pseudomonadota bacterium]
LTGAEAAPVPWNDLVSGLATQEDLRGFAMEVWKNRAIMGDGLQERPEDLARMLLLRELLRRPKVQNNPETMGLLRLAFPKLEEKALLQTLPQPFPDAGLDREDWRGLALAAVDMTFRIQLAVDVDTWIIPVVAPRTGYLKSYAPPGTRKGERSEHAYGWPSGRSGRSRLVKLVYALIGGGVGDRAAEDRADIVLDALWRLIGSTICIDVGRGEMRLDFSQAAVQRLDKAWICPVTRRPFGYAAARRSPFAPDRFMSPRDWPRLPQANRGGLSDQASNEVAEWVRRDPVVADLREAGFWTDLHDRIAAYPRYLRAQEHSAQIPRKVLQRYEETFKAGGINLLNCSTTMEMGVDIPNVRLVLNANAPPALSNYRQRVGRAGRRNEPWAFGVTFCRDLPLDRRAFYDPCAYLRQKIVAPKVLLDSPAQIARHANAMLLAAWLADATEGLRIQENVGAFLGATKTLEETPDHAAPIDAFIAALRGEWGAAPALADRIATLLRGSVLADEPPRRRMEATAEAADRFARRWRREHGALLERAALLDPDGGRDGGDAAMSLTLRAARMRGEFLVAELARRGFAPSDGFPTDVVAFDHRAGLRGEEGDAAPAFGFRARGASRPLDIAIREYAPGAEVVIDGLVHMSEGVRPAWSAGTDASRLEDLGAFWRCERCGGAGMTSQSPETCPACGERVSHVRRTLRPAGFLGRRKPHSGYEMLAQTPYQRPEIVAAGADWQALPDPEAGRFRSAPEGHVHSLSSGAQGGGFAICLDCGRAEAMPPPDAAFATPLPEALRRHAPLAPVRNRTRDGLCPASDAPHRIQRHVHLAHDAMTDVFEFQAPHGVQPKPCLAFGAGLREALADMLGVEAREIGVTLADSRGPAGEARRSVCLFDRAPGGAGYATRLADGELFTAALRGALERLACPENCGTGCPACVLRPDLNQRDVEMDREGGRALAADLLRRIALPDALRVFGEGTAMLGRRLGDWLADEERSGRIADLTVFLQGSPKDWDFEGAGFAP